jgi:membrane peptidoglycan carboxypeptidase
VKVLGIAGRAAAGIAAILVISVGCGLLLGATVLPVVTVGAGAAQTGEKVVSQIPSDLAMPELAEKSYLYSSNGDLLTTFYLQNRVVVGLDEISQPMQDAVVALEDRRFWEHSGVDVQGMARAFINNSTNGSTQGASTLTQQLVKNSLIEQATLNHDEELAEKAVDFSYARKLREAKLAVAIEKQYGKKKILEGYLNIAQFGPSQWGVEAAALYYFGVSAKDLNVVQAATIAAITQQPNVLDPKNHPEANQPRRDAALAAMLRDKYITKEQYDEAVALNVADTLKITPTKSGCEAADQELYAGYFCDYVVSVIRNSEAFGKDPQEREQLLARGGLHITTTLDPTTQQNAVAALDTQIPYDDPSGVAHALTAVEPGTGRIIAMAQNRYYESTKSDRPGYTSVNYNVDEDFGGSIGFQPGSTFKPFILAAWLEAGHSLQETFDGSKTVYQPAHFKASCLDGGHTWDARWSVSGGARKSVNAYTATASSLNAAYAAMEYKLDMCKIQDLIERMGIKRASGKEWGLTPSMVLGTHEVSPLTMAAAYATFAADGRYCPPTAIDSVTWADGTALDIPVPACSQALDQGVARGVSAALKRVVSSGTGTAARLNDGRPVAGKTGTTDKAKAAWFCGYTPQLATAVWAGHPDKPEPLRGKIGNQWYGEAFGGTLSAHTFGRFMSSSMEGKERLDFGNVPTELERGKLVKVPSVLGMNLDSAKQQLSEAGFSVEVGDSIHSDRYPEGLVAEQSPNGQSYPNSTITLKLSQGPPPAAPPSTPVVP